MTQIIKTNKNKMDAEDIKKIIVSDEFVEIYKNFNVVTQVELMNNLSKKELYLLLIFCLDKFSDEDPVVKHNFFPFKEEVMSIFEIQDEKETTNQYLLELISETDDKYIETEMIRDKFGNKLPDPLSKEEVRDAKIKIINND